MLESITVRNFALIKESEIVLAPGLNILTGETGAGKSIILGSIRLALGERASKEIIRSGAEYALVELVFTSNQAEVLSKLKELDIPEEPDGSICISRRIMESRSVAKCNGETISSRALKELASLLIDIHGQNDTQTLLDAKNYRDILDDYIGDEIADSLEVMNQLYRDYVALTKELDEAGAQDESRVKDVDFARFELEEIDNARLIIGEDEELEQRYTLMKNSKRIAEALGKASSALDMDNGACAGMGYALRELNSVSEYDSGVCEIADSLASAEDIIRDALRTIQGYMDDMDFSEQDYRETEERLDVINHLKNKYGNTIEDVLAYADNRRDFIEKMSDYDAYLEKLKIRVDDACKQALSQAKKISGIRRSGADKLQKELIANLEALNFNNIEFRIDIDSGEEKLGRCGYDEVDFLVSFNVGESVRSLSQVASGGELSRFMLALKASTGDRERIGTLIFDEIDSGISGKTAWNVSEKMSAIASGRQVIAITHLPQIAAMADTHFLIEKSVADGETVTDIGRLSDEEHLREIARLLSGGEVTDSALLNAKELLVKANK